MKLTTRQLRSIIREEVQRMTHRRRLAEAHLDVSPSAIPDIAANIATMTKPKTQPCPECGGEMRFEKRPDEVSYQGHTRALKTLGWWCSKCGESILEGEALQASERAFLELKAEVAADLAAAYNI